MALLFYYCHRYRNPDPATQQSNLARAKLRFAYLAPGYRARGIILWDPWLALAWAGVDEELSWHIIETCVRSSAGVVLDCDGPGEPSEGMRREESIALAVGGKVEVVG